MATKVEKMEQYTAQLQELGVDVDTALLEKVTDGLGPANYNEDAAYVAASDEAEVKRVYTNYVADELAVSDEEAGMAAINEVLDMMSGINKKHRAVVYYLLAQKLG
jgi:hypothetical protein